MREESGTSPELGVPCLGVGIVGGVLSALWTAVPADSRECPALWGACLRLQDASGVMESCRVAGYLG